ncbi:ComF family protein [Candidatus Vondammii sp. HM_W22]|uniref:ComF family protein n=1 Tax=Candidatus Vondammii sp. HM_W22 TaxID=2687299 RepID=UPI001F12CC02|nr:ComF family protein [Candidatus Vondammii sp. HM_W22]
MSPFHYAAPVDLLISRFKFNGKLHIGRLLSSLLGNFILQQQSRLPELITPVPLHSTRLRQRGYNQSLELARPLSRRLNIPLNYACCRRVKLTAPQSDLERGERRRNIRGAFEVTVRFQDTHIVLVDDVVTTGSTVSELAREFKRAGAKQVDVWAVARTW